MLKKVTLGVVATQKENGYNEVQRVESTYGKIKQFAVAASLLTLRFYNTKSGVRIASIRIYIPNTRSYREIKLPLNQELFDAIISIWFGQEPKEITSYDTTGWEAEPEEDFGFEMFKLLHEAGVRMSVEDEKVKEGKVIGVPFKIKKQGKFVIDLYQNLNEEVENYLKANNLRW